MAGTAFEFIVGNTPRDLQWASSTRRIKSHLSRRGWEAYRQEHRRKRPCSHQKKPRTMLPSRGTKKAVSSELEIEPDSDKTPTPPLEIQFVLGGARVDPFWSCPMQPEPYVPALIDHYVVHMAVPIPELDQYSPPGQLRSSWFPLVLSDAATFNAVMLLAADNYSSLNHTTSLGCQILQLKAEAIRCINEAFSDPKRCVTDSVIGAVVKMASYEAIQGDVESYDIHMLGLQRMVAMRGGLDHLGLGGLLRRIIIWVDLNSAFLLKTPRYLPGETFSGEEITSPNPVKFIAA